MKRSLFTAALFTLYVTSVYAQSPSCNPYAQTDQPCPPPHSQPGAVGPVGIIEPYPGQSTFVIPAYDTQKIDELVVSDETPCVWVIVENDSDRAQVINVMYRFQSESNMRPMHKYVTVPSQDRIAIGLHTELATYPDGTTTLFPRGVTFSATAYLAASGSVHATTSNCSAQPNVISAHAQK